MQGVGDFDVNIFRSHAMLFQETQQNRQAQDAEVLIFRMVVSRAAILDTDSDFCTTPHQFVQGRHANRMSQGTAEGRGCIW
jgi:hypothetical protein